VKGHGVEEDTVRVTDIAMTVLEAIEAGERNVIESRLVPVGDFSWSSDSSGGTGAARAGVPAADKAEAIEVGELSPDETVTTVDIGESLAGTVDTLVQGQPPAADAPAPIDDLKRVSGVGPVLEEFLHSKGIFTFAQLAGLTQAQVDELETEQSFPNRIDREDWRGQAARLGAETDTPARAAASTGAGLTVVPATGEPDPISEIRSMSPSDADRLNELGITTFAQIAALDDASIDALEEALELPGRIRRFNWVGQATLLMQQE
jgi:predicted flap endonuclease-1-like 5' DNA nuclease